VIASNLSVIDLLSKDETVPSVIARLSGRFVCSSGSQSICIARSGSLLRTRTPKPTLIPLASNCAISDKKRALIWLYASLETQSHSDPSHGRRKRQTNCNRCEKRSKDFSSQMRPVKSVLVGIGDLRVRAVTLKSVNFGQDCIRPQAKSSTSFQMRRLTTALS
jgi:hypothetical protein